MNTLLRNGTVVTEGGALRADVLITGETIGAIGADLSALAGPLDAHIVDASERFILPGGIDVHTHLDVPFGGTRVSDDFFTGQRAAAFNGTTCHIDFARQDKGESLASTIDRWHAMARDRAVIDYGFHLAITDATDAVIDEIPAIGRAGVTSLKLFMAYKGFIQVDDATLYRTMRAAGAAGMLTMVHAENGDVVDVLVREAVARGDVAPRWHAHTRPNWTEAEATARAVAMATALNAPLYVVHVTCREAAAEIARARAAGAPVMGETCIQYLYFTADQLDRPDGAKWVCSPPLRSEADQQALWRALQDDALQVISTDHSPFFYDGNHAIEYDGAAFRLPGKDLGAGNFSRIPNGVAGIGNRMPLLWSHAVANGRLSLTRFVETCCTNPARIFGLYPRKGTIRVGSDADIVLWDPTARRTMGAATSRHRLDHDLYEGLPLIGYPEKVFLRGRLIVDSDAFLAQPGSGQWLPRS